MRKLYIKLEPIEKEILRLSTSEPRGEYYGCFATFIREIMGLPERTPHDIVMGRFLRMYRCLDMDKHILLSQMTEICNREELLSQEKEEASRLQNRINTLKDYLGIK